MMMTRELALRLLGSLHSFEGRRFDVNTQYKMLKLKYAIEQEQKIYNEQILTNCDQYFEHDANGYPIINNDGGYKIKPDGRTACYRILEQLNQCEVQLPDVYFTIDEFADLNLTLGELEPFMPCIK